MTGFSHEEFEQRQDNARQLMQRHGLDGLMITDAGNLFYFTGYPYSAERGFARPAVLVIPREAPSALLVHQFYFPPQWQGELRRYDAVSRSPVELMAETIQSLCGRAAVIGTELGYEHHLGISYQDFESLRTRMPAIDFQDASSLLWQLRNKKSAAEIAAIREACGLHDAIFEKCFSLLETGMSTREVEGLFQQAALDVGGKNSGAIVCIGPFEAEQAAGSSSPSRRLGIGEICWVDFSLGWQGYRTDYCRAVVAGGPKPEQQQLWTSVNDVLMAGFGAATVGANTADIAKAQLARAEVLGLDMTTWMARRYGHSSGIRTTEPPSVSVHDETPLVPGMVIHLEPGVIGADGVYVREEMILITDGGPQWLSKAPWPLGQV